MNRTWIPLLAGLAVLGATGYLVLTGEPGDGSGFGLLGLLGLLGLRHGTPRS
jgi:MYXO-CTERM domain-containing protein